MGAFIIVDPKDEEKDPGEQGGKVLMFDDLKQHFQDPNFKFLTITSAYIQDRSKDDTLSKIITILHSDEQGFQSRV